MDDHLPDPGDMEYLLDLFMEAGPHKLDWKDIRAFSDCCGYELDGWECEQLHRMTAIYTSCYQRFDMTNEPPPYSDKERIASVIDQMRLHLRATRGTANGGRSKVSTTKG